MHVLAQSVIYKSFDLFLERVDDQNGTQEVRLCP